MIVNSLKISVYRGFPGGLESAHVLNSSEYLQLMGCKGIYIANFDCKWFFAYVLGLIEAVGTGNKFGIFQTFYRAVIGGRPSGLTLILSSLQCSILMPHFILDEDHGCFC